MTAIGTLYGIGVGPGDPEWLTLKAVRVLAGCRHICVPQSRLAADSVALDIARPHLRHDAEIHRIVFPMSTDAAELDASWRRAAETVRDILVRGDDCCFLTLGDALLYSTYIYLLRALRAVAPGVRAVTIPGITAFSAVAAMTQTPIGEGKDRVTIVPTADDLEHVERALDGGGTVILMKIGKRLPAILRTLETRRLLGQAVFAAHVGLPGQRIETDLTRLVGTEDERMGYLSLMIVHAGRSLEGRVE